MNSISKRLRAIMAEKKSNLSVAADLLKCQEILDLAESIGDHICILKTHIDVVEDITPEFFPKLREVADRKNFLIFEDRKFADIGNTVSLQFSAGVYHIADWADIVNAHPIIGPGIIEGLQKVNKRSGLLLLAQMTPKDNLFTKEYALKTVELAKKYPDFVMGFIGSSDKPETLNAMREAAGDYLFIMTPGIKLSEGGDGLGQTYNTPKKSIENGGDVIIVGRGIYQAKNPKLEAIKYQEAGWEAQKKS